MNHIRPLLAPLLAALIVSLSGCSPAKEDQPPKPKVTAGASAGEVPSATKDPAGVTAGTGAAAGSPSAAARNRMALPRIGPAPGWQLKDVNGATVSSDQYKGKVVVLDFWATWCPPCVKEIPGYTELARKHGPDGLVIVGVSLDQAGPEVVKKFAARYNVHYPLVMADEGIVAAFGGVEAIPTTFLIDRQGQIRDRKVGAEETAEYEKKILALLQP